MRFSDLEQMTDPYPTYVQWREQTPIFWAEDVQAWVVTRYEDVRYVLKNPRLFSSELAAIRSSSSIRLPLLHDDPPRHTPLRSVVNRSFTTKAMTMIEGDLEQLVEELLAALDDTHAVNIAADFTIPLPVAVIARLMGIPVELKDDFKRWSDALTGVGVTKSMEERMPDILEMMEFFRNEIPKRKQAPGDDLISKVVAAEIEGENLSEQEIVGYCQLLLIAGNETTTNLLSNLLYYLADKPELWSELRAQPEKADAAIEEILRFNAPVHWVNRVTTEDLILGEQQIKEGDAVITVMAASNRDPQHYEDPDNFRLDRPRSDHHTFGHGIHFCVGAPLARVEARYALQGLLKRYSGLSHPVGQTMQNEPTHSSMLRGYHNLWLCFTP